MQETKLIGSNGRPNWGIHAYPLLDLNVEALRPYGRNGSKSVGDRVARFFRLKRWEYFGVATAEIFFGAAVISLGYLSQAFAYVFERHGQRLTECAQILPLAAGVKMSGASDAGIVKFSHRQNRLSFQHSTAGGVFDVSFASGLKAQLRMEKSPSPLVYVGRNGIDGFNYTHKEAGLAVGGKVELPGKRWEVTPQDSFGVRDYTMGLLGRQTFWNWASGGGFTREGVRVGFNLVQGINETGRTENSLWIGGKLVKVDMVDFAYTDFDLQQEWRIVSNDGKVNIKFLPEGQRSANENMGVLASKFHQAFGTFTGEVGDGDKTHTLAAAHGFTEEHVALW